MREFVATCWGGPIEGQTIAASKPSFDVARHKRLALTYIGFDEDTLAQAIPYQVDRYRYERFAFEPFVFGAWVVGLPSERREAVHETIVNGLNLIAWLCNPSAPVDTKETQ